jgi:hypothetical protein
MTERRMTNEGTTKGYQTEHIHTIEKTGVEKYPG